MNYEINFHRLADLTNKMLCKVSSNEEYLEYLKIHAILNQKMQSQRFKSRIDLHND